MLRPPHDRYEKLHVYYLDRRDLPPVDDPDLIGIWVEDDTAILFFHRERGALVDRLCRQCGAGIIYQASLDYRDWEAGVQVTSFATAALCVRPVWEAAGAGPSGPEEIVLDPSVIFGSGFHATTRLCLENLESLMLAPERRIRSVLDLGTGTGLLAIAAARLGAERVLALDNNPLAVEVARKNVTLNNCCDRVLVEQADLLDGGMPGTRGYDLVVANLYKGLLTHLFASAQFWQGQMYLVSGFLPGMEAELLSALPSGSIRMLHRGMREQWRLWLLERKV
ncbi:MAG TPA: methyltransferase domain-containing protein [Desulfobulbus sp.]|nr:methyltransferase domain-containing protein [Desulfobulbus sp.]